MARYRSWHLLNIAVLLFVSTHLPSSHADSSTISRIFESDEFKFIQTLEGEGFHRALVFNLTVSNSDINSDSSSDRSNSNSDSNADSNSDSSIDTLPLTCSILVVSVLPSGIYIDVDELGGLALSERSQLVVEPGQPSYLDVEQPTDVSLPFRATTPLEKSSAGVLTGRLPIHFRYNRAKKKQDTLDGYVKVKIVPPTLCAVCDRTLEDEDNAGSIQKWMDKIYDRTSASGNMLCQQALQTRSLSNEVINVSTVELSFQAIRTSEEVTSEHGGGLLIANIPYGLVEHLSVVQLLTMAVTSGAAILLVVETMRVTREKL